MRQSPPDRRQRRWLIAALLAPVPTVIAWFIGGPGKAALAASITVSLVLLIAVLVWAAQRDRRERREFEDRLDAAPRRRRSS